VLDLKACHPDVLNYHFRFIGEDTTVAIAVLGMVTSCFSSFSPPIVLQNILLLPKPLHFWKPKMDHRLEHQLERYGIYNIFLRPILVYRTPLGDSLMLTIGTWCFTRLCKF
jgi:hypothetical protein